VGFLTTGGVVGTTSTPGTAEAHHFLPFNRKLKIIVGFIVGGIALVLTGGLILFRRCLGKKQIEGSGIRPFTVTSLPNSASNAPATLVPVRLGDWPPYAHVMKNRDELCPVRQMEIDQHLQTAQQEVVNLTSMQTAMSNSRPGLSLSSEIRRQEVENEMEALREQMHQLRAQIEQSQTELFAQ
jgi:hypothetical protein